MTKRCDCGSTKVTSTCVGEDLYRLKVWGAAIIRAGVIKCSYCAWVDEFDPCLVIDVTFADKDKP